MPNLGTLTKLGVLNLYIEHFQSDSCFSSLAAFCFQTGNGRFPLSAKFNLLTRHLKFRSVQLFKDQSLGIGSYGAVYKAKCDDLLCAAKILHPTLFDPTSKRAQTTNQEV